MLEFERHAEKALDQWKNSRRHKPIVIRGARQVGKTTLVRKFKSKFQYYIELNMERSVDKKWAETTNSPIELMNALSIKYGIERENWKNTLLFIDEIQEVPKMMEYLRFFYEDIPELYVIAAGSLLEYSFDKVETIPVGRIQYLYLFPLNFAEFLSATGHKNLIPELEKNVRSSSTHNFLMEIFHTYLILGGMPEIIGQYMESQDIASLLPTYSSIWDTYKDDIPKYASNDSERRVIEYLILSSPQMVDKRITFQNFGASNYKSREVGEAFRALDAAKVIQLIYPTTGLIPPPITNLRKSPKLQFLDTGLLNYDLGIQDKLLLLKDMNEAYRGAIIPHLITQELISLNVLSYKKPNFWVRNKNQSEAEVDLVFQYKELLIPIEIKSGSVGKLRSLHQFVDRCSHPYAIRVYGGEFHIQKLKTPSGKVYKLLNLPYYLGTQIPNCVEDFVENH